jgi:hypothetical protein
MDKADKIMHNKNVEAKAKLKTGKGQSNYSTHSLILENHRSNCF